MNKLSSLLLTTLINSSLFYLLILQGGSRLPTRAPRLISTETGHITMGSAQVLTPEQEQAMESNCPTPTDSIEQSVDPWAPNYVPELDNGPEWSILTF